MTIITSWIEENLFIPSGMQIRMFKTVFIILFMSLAYSSLKKLLYKLIKDGRVYYRAKKTSLYIVIAILFILVGRIWFEGINSFVTFMGLFSAALAIVMKDVILNIAGWFFIMFKAPFRVGDRIEIDGVAGDVIDIQLFSFVIMEIKNWINGDKYTGRIVYMPNVTIFNQSLANYNKEIPYVWNELPISLLFSSNWRKAKEILNEIAYRNTEGVVPEAERSLKDASRTYGELNERLEPKVYTKIDNQASNITFTIRYICPYKKKRGSAEKIYEEILEEFAKHDDIEFAYPVNLVYLNRNSER